MENVMKKRIEKKDPHGTRKRPYAKPTLTVHGNVDEITKVLRLAGAKNEDFSIDNFL
jgi:hypothetical protein